jgi:hypothetical protein
MKNIAELVTFLLEVLRGRTCKWDVAKDAIKSKDRAVRLLVAILAFAPPFIAALAGLYYVVTR